MASQEGSGWFANGFPRVSGDRKRSKTRRGLEPVFGVAPRFSRIDTLKSGDVEDRGAFGCSGFRGIKLMRGGREPNG
jgi:hypothetical protein